MGAGVGDPGAVNFEVTGSSEETMGVGVVQEDQTTPLVPEAALPVRHGVRVPSMKKSPRDAASVALKQAVRPTRATWPPLTRKPLHPKRGCSLRFLLLHRQREVPHHQPQPDSPLLGVVVSSLQGGCHRAGAEVGGGPLLLFALAGALQLSLWFQRNLQQVLYSQVRSL